MVRSQVLQKSLSLQAQGSCDHELAREIVSI